MMNEPTMLLAGLPDDTMIKGIQSSGTKVTSDAINFKILDDIKIENSKNIAFAGMKFESNSPCRK